MFEVGVSISRCRMAALEQPKDGYHASYSGSQVTEVVHRTGAGERQIVVDRIAVARYRLDRPWIPSHHRQQQPQQAGGGGYCDHGSKRLSSPARSFDGVAGEMSDGEDGCRQKWSHPPGSQPSDDRRTDSRRHGGWDAKLDELEASEVLVGDGEGDLVVNRTEEACQQAGEGDPEEVFCKKSRKFHGVGIWGSA